MPSPMLLKEHSKSFGSPVTSPTKAPYGQFIPSKTADKVEALEKKLAEGLTNKTIESVRILHLP
jgi:hypothetical protein